jgi:cytidyltransferase-like protein
MSALFKKGMVFGVFDNFHPGHEYFLSSAKNKCTELFVVVTLPHVVKLIKKRVPHHALEQRIENIKNYDARLSVVEGDAVLGAWNIFKMYNPDIIFLGYDQQGIARELDKLGMLYEYIDAHYPEKYKSSLMRPL